MPARSPETVRPGDVLSFWFGEGLETIDPDGYAAFWQSRMQGGMDAAIIADWPDVTRAAAMGAFDDWAADPHGRLALVLTLDQFPRSLWRDTPAAYAQDIKATRLVLEGLDNGHYDALRWPWERNFFIIAMTHCEGPDHLARMDRALDLARALPDLAPEHLRDFTSGSEAQCLRVRGIIERFGRHPHRNPVYGRVSTPDEQAYIDTGDFPHLRRPETPAPSS